MVYLNEEIGRIKKVVNQTNAISFVEKEQLIEKIDELKNKPVDKEIVESILHFQSLVKELQE
jgi:chorismate mutase